MWKGKVKRIASLLEELCSIMAMFSLFLPHFRFRTASDLSKAMNANLDWLEQMGAKFRLFRACPCSLHFIHSLISLFRETAEAPAVQRRLDEFLSFRISFIIAHFHLPLRPRTHLYFCIIFVICYNVLIQLSLSISIFWILHILDCFSLMKHISE